MSNRVTGTCCTASVERAGLPGLLRDLQRLSEDQDTADLVFILGPSEEKVYAHRIILIARCKSFQSTKRGEVCRIPGCSVSPSVGGQPAPIRMAHVQPETFRLAMQYVYTGKVCKSFQSTKRGEVCRIPGCSVSPSVGGQPAPIRMAHVQPETFRLAMQYVYTGKVCKSFQRTKRGEVCRIPGCSVSPSVGGQPAPIRMAHVQPESFRLAMQYVYTAKLLLQDSGVFEMMTLAADLGIEDLRAACEDHVTSTLSVESACTLLAAAMEIQERPGVGGKSASSFLERCIAFIGDNAADCVKTNAFLNLPKEALIKLISSDFLCLEEEEVWRCALAWAKQRAGVTQPTAHWTEEERARVCHHLAPLMQHVRLLLIDSAVFAEEVEPTGAVPMELSLERYRRAALQHPHAHAPSAHRLAVNLFAGSVILQQERSAFQTVINNWCGTPKQSWRLVFRASTHGFSAQAFHSHCDGVAPVVVLVQLPRGEVLGGYSETAWSAGGAGGYVAAERAFLFALPPAPAAPPPPRAHDQHQAAPQPAKYPLLKKAVALCYHPDCGPIFGAGADLLVASNCNSNTDSYSNLHSYGCDGAPASLAPDYSFTVRDYEVFTCKPN